MGVLNITAYDKTYHKTGIGNSLLIKNSFDIFFYKNKNDYICIEKQFKYRHYEKFSNLQRLPNTKGSS